MKLTKKIAWNVNALFCVLWLAQSSHAEVRELSAEVYRDKVYGSWLGQCVGNYYGLVFENRFIDEVPKDLPREITGWTLDAMRGHDGAFSDDDTDIEYMYVFLMEEKGVEPTYADIAERWVRHINRRIWVANYEARGLMGRGFLPPDTGRKGLNSHWFQIDAQLINEIWAVTAPGMIDYASAKSDWAARITNDDFGTHPTIWYGAMYSAAFFESDTKKLYDIGLAHVPPGRFRDALLLVRSMHREGRPWHETRALLKELYFDNCHESNESRPSSSLKSIVDATLNGAMGALALLYGEGDFEETLYLSCMAGFDCDNQAATLAGLFGVAHGAEVFPRKFLHPVEGWDKPFNDRYIVVTRNDLPDETLTQLTKRTVQLGERVIQLNGGTIRTNDQGDRIYEIDTDAEFKRPVEIRWHPVEPLRIGQPARLEFWGIGGKRDRQALGAFPGYDTGQLTCVEVGKVSGEVPGLTAALQPGNAPGEGFASWATGRPAKIVLTGTPTQAGLFELTFDVYQSESDKKTTQVSVALPVLGENLALGAEQIIASESETEEGRDGDFEILRDGRRYDLSFNRYGNGESKSPHWYGYEWSRPQPIAQLFYTAGNAPRPFDEGGFWKSFDVEYKDDQGQWKSVEQLRVSPDVLIRWSWPHRTHTITFEPVNTTAIRIIGTAGGSPQATSVAELEVYADVQAREDRKASD